MWVGLLRNAGDVFEEIGIEFGEGFAEFCDFLGRAVDLDSEELGEGEGFLDAGPDIFKVTEDSGCSDVGFTAEDDVVADGEVVVKASVFGAGAGHEFLHRFLEGIKFTRLDFEIRVDADGLRELAHVLNCEW